MNKKTKGLISLAAGAALFAGTAGTFALWFDTTPAGAAVSPIATGDLYLDGSAFTGAWAWTKVSNTPDGGPVVRDAYAGGALVPGDEVQWTWSEDAISYFLSGQTIVAELWLDGAAAPITAEALHPLVLDVEFFGHTLDFADGSVLIDSDLVAGAAAQDSAFEAPEFTVTFPVDRAGENGWGHLPGDQGTGYGRRRESIEIIDVSNVSIRLQQVAAN